MNFKLLFNPFEKFSEVGLAVTGLSVLLFSIILFWVTGQTNDGIYHVIVSIWDTISTGRY
ncbi:hypothetical protein U0035_09880 [Niabella yanshanensis]|uniref:Uncharacterized protein n=1 Tax=Niabella yanshanensis TaxID=577386 RepID=A0ABZ0WCW2_9BACT|nr:hypothetical protein [Niabella yanshanensis]WQD40455.1 hypothetical protein U0035_09880 [Niabella yanshanensis]